MPHAEAGPALRPLPRPEYPLSSQIPRENPGTGEVIAWNPRPRWRPDPSCTPDGGYCITPIRYLHDVCRTIEGVAQENDLDPHFMARLLWRESLFDPYAISPAGAMGIAQFMPGTAKLRGLDDPFNPAEAMQASAAYLSELKEEFGNVGLAAAAYNGGEARLTRYLNDKGGLPGETRAYVHAITGRPVDDWRSVPTEEAAFTATIKEPFHETCMSYAVRAPKLEVAPAQYPWAMIYAAHASNHIAERRARWFRERFPELLDGAETSPRRMRLPGRRRTFYAVQAGHATQVDASAHCDRLRAAGGSCMVLRN